MPTTSKPSVGGPVAHSPAPWRRFGGVIMAADDKQVCALVPTDDAGTHLRSIAEDDANQSLIAAAPELLSQLSAVLSLAERRLPAQWKNHESETDHPLVKARALLDRITL